MIMQLKFQMELKLSENFKESLTQVTYFYLDSFPNHFSILIHCKTTSLSYSFSPFNFSKEGVIFVLRE